MIELLRYYYNIYINDFREVDNVFYFTFNNKKYCLVNIEYNKFDIIFNSQKYPFFHRFVINKFNDYISMNYNKYYIVLEILYDLNRLIELRDVINMISINKNYYVTNIIIDYSKLWRRKLEYYNNLYRYKKNYYFEYFMGLGRNAILISKSVNYNNVNYGFNIKRIFKEDGIFKFWNPSFLVYGASVSILSEYIKCRFFYYNEEVDLKLINDLEFNSDEKKLLISKLIFPTYYFDLINCNEADINKNKIDDIISKVENYIKYVNKFF